MIQGLTDKEVASSRKMHGTNRIAQKKKNTFLKLFLESLGDPIIKILIIALIIKVIFLFKDFDFFETIGILLSILIASFVSSISEYGSEAAFKKLEEESSKIKVRVLRNKKDYEIPIDEVVVGDIVKLNTGDKVPADGIIKKGRVELNESAINGESASVEKEYNNEIYRGTIILSGECLMKVLKVGENTIIGSIAKELQSDNPYSPLKERLTVLAKQISKLGYLGAILVSLSYLFSKIVIENSFNINFIINDLTNIKLMAGLLLHALTISVTVIVVSVPEGLPLMITLVLSSNMRRMLKDNVLVRKLVGIETSGNINYLITDKTGTITCGELKVSKLITGNLREITKYNDISNRNYKNLIYKSIYYNNSSYYDKEQKAIGGNTTDKSLLNFIEYNFNIDYKIIDYLPFDSKNKYSYVTLEEDNKITYIKGAPERIISNCLRTVNELGEEVILKNKKEIENILETETKKGNRVIALASSKNFHLTKKLSSLTFIGLVVIKDEIRDSSKESIEIIKNAGITPIMITGDDINTAINIAKETGIISDKNDIALSGEEFNRLTDEEVLKYHQNIKVIARALPKDKSRLVSILQSQKYVVGMTGDGVNDAPALKKSDVGFSMGSGTEVAKEASDIVILDDNIKSITKAILYGRTIFKSIRKFIVFQLSLNICALIISIIGPFIGIDTPITIVQMLWINMIMDTLAGIAFSYEPPLQEYMEEKPISREVPIIDKYMKSEIIVSGLYQALICILFLKLPFIKELIRFDSEGKYLMTSYFTLFVFMGVFNSFNARTKRINIFANLKQNKPFTLIILFITITQLIITYFGQNIFRTYGLTFFELIFVIIIALSIIPVDWIRKYHISHAKIDK